MEFDARVQDVIPTMEALPKYGVGTEVLVHGAIIRKVIGKGIVKEIQASFTGEYVYKLSTRTGFIEETRLSRPQS